MAYTVALPDGRTVEFPDEVPKDKAAAIIQQQFPNLAPPAAKPAPFSLSDTLVSAAQGALGGTKSLVEGVTGAGSSVGESLEGAQQWLGGKLSPERQAEQRRRAMLEQQAAQTGKPLEEVAAGLGGIKEAPIQSIAQGVGSSLPTVLAGVGAAALGATVGAPVAIAAAVGIGTKYLLGALQGAGEVKGSIYDAVKERLQADGMSEAQAKKQAIAAQDYLGKNWDTIAAGAGIGGIAGGTGVESALLKKLSKPVAAKTAAKAAEKGALREFGEAGLKEGLGEGIQGGQGQMAENIGLTREGFQTDAMKGVYGAAARDAALGALTGSAVHPFTGRPAQSPAPTTTPTTESKGPQVPPEAPAGTQGTLFSEKEMGERVPAAPAEPQAPEAKAPEGQMDLGLDYARQAEDVSLEIERLKQQEQTPEVKDRIAQLEEDLRTYSQLEVERLRGEKEQAAAAEREDREARAKFPALANAPDLIAQSDEVKARTQGELFPGEDLGTKPAAEPTTEPTLRRAAEKGPRQMPLGLRRNPEGQPTTFGEPEPTFTSEDVLMTAIPVRKGMESWIDKNIIGSTRTQLLDLIARHPELAQGSDQRAKLLRALTATEVPAFKESPNVTKPTRPQAQPATQPRTGEPSVGVSGQPAATELPQPGAGVPGAPAAPVAPVGRGLVPTGQPAGKGAQAQGAKPAAVETQDERRARLRAEKAEREERTTHEATMDGKPVIVEIIRDKTSDTYKGRKNIVEVRIKGLTRVPMTMAYGGYESDAEVLTSLREAEVLDETQTPTPTVAGKPAPAAAPTKAPQAPSPAVATETVEEEAARKTEAEDFKRRLEEQAKAAAQGRTAPRAIPTPPTPPAKPAPTAAAPEAEEEIAPIPNRPNPFAGVTQAAAEARARRESKGRAANPKVAIPTQWAAKHAIGGQQIVYEDSEVALVRAVNPYGEAKYFAMDNSGNQAMNSLDSRSQPSWLSAEQKARLSAAMADAQINEHALAASNPDGPFTAASSNVVVTDSLNPNLSKYASELLRSIGLGDLRLFIYTTDDMHAAGAVDRYKLYGKFARPARFHKDSLNGSAGPMGPSTDNTFAVFLNPKMSEGKTLEVLAHEIGHIVERTAYDTADAATRKAIQDEYMAWRKTARTATTDELMHMLRNREDAEWNVALIEKAGKTGTSAAATLENFDKYWTGFGEWFADNVSRWATTNEKPLSIADKFFSKLAQRLRDLVAIVTGRKYPPAKSVADFLNAAGPADFRPTESSQPSFKEPMREQFSVSVGTESLVDSMGPLDAQQKSSLTNLIKGFKTQADVNYATKFRTQAADSAATIEHRLREKFDGAVRDSLGKLNPMGLFRQAQDYTKTLLEYFQQGSLVKDPVTGLWKVATTAGVRPPAEVYAKLDAWAAKHGYDRERGTQIASRILEGVRLDAMRTANRTQGTDFLLHLKDHEIDQLVREYNADPDLQAMSKLMDEARIAMVDNMVAVGRLSKEQGDEWKNVVGYVPFDRIEDFADNYRKVKKVSNKGIAQIGKLPELIGSETRMVGNVFDNYLNTLGWMVGQTMKTDGTVQTLRSLEDIGQAKFLGRSPLGRDNTVGMYVGGEMMYWELPSKYDVLAFKDLNPPKAGWLRALGSFSNVLRKSVTVLPPFALKQVTDDVQRAIMTSGVKNPGALLRMSLTNFPKLVLAELKGIQHPMVREFGALGLTGEYDFEAGKPATSLLKDLGYKQREVLGSSKLGTLLHRLDGITRASDLAVRKAIYDQTMKETGDQLLAQTRAREFINFRRRGASDFVGAMVTVVPFFNAYIQGMDVLYRAASGKDSSSSIGRAEARRMFWSRAATVMMLSSLYALGKDDDDEDYKEMDLRTRDGNWILPGGMKIPVPGELGAIFKVIPERVVEYMKRQGTPEEQTAWEATRTALTYMYEQYLGRSVPVPQAIKPVLEAWANKSFLTGRELEGIHHKTMDPSMRRNEQTSELAQAIADFSRDSVGVEVSPIMIDNALRGYFGSTAALLTATTDSLLNPTRVDRPLHKWALLSNYMYDPVGTRRMTEFYEAREEVGKANATLKELMKTDFARAEAYANAHQDELMLEGAINSTLEQLENTRAYRKFLNSPDGAKEMSAEQREKELQEIKRMEIELTGWVREAKTELRKLH